MNVVPGRIAGAGIPGLIFARGGLLRLVTAAAICLKAAFAKSWRRLWWPAPPINDARIRALNDVWWHAGGNVVVVLIELYSWYARYTQGTAAVVPKGLILSLIVVCILAFTGWKGWDMVYRARVGIADANETYGHRPGQPPRRTA
jgi:uncharacterized membrane protein